MADNTTNDLRKLKDIFFGKKARRIYKILVVAFVALTAISVVSTSAIQSRLEKENVKITITDINDELHLDYNSTSQEIKAKILGISPLAKAHITDKEVAIKSISEKDAGEISYKLENLREGENKIIIRVEDGKRSVEKTIIIRRQTKEDHDKQELEKAINHVEELLKRAEEDSSEENVSNVRADFDKLPEDKRQQFTERIEKLENTIKERKEKERLEEEKRKQEEEERKIREENAKKAEEERRNREKVEAEEQKVKETQNVQQAPPAPAPQPQPQTSNLPLKAICRDGTVSYQDSPALNTYRGMCSGHKGIKQRLGRIP